jgi:transposase
MDGLYIGIDLHSASFQACAVASDGGRCWEEKFPRTDSGIAAFRQRCAPGARVAIEATTPTWHFADAIHDVVAAVTVVDPLRTRLKAGYAAKTDRLDARRLADALRRDSVVGIYYPPGVVRELRELTRSRHTLVRTRTMLIQRLRAVLLRHGIQDATQRLTRGRGLAWLDTLVLPAQATASVTRVRRVLETVIAEVHAVDPLVEQTAARDPIVAALRTVPGIGPILGVTIRAEIGDIARFATPAHLASYCGLVPRVDASAGYIRHGHITKHGSPWLRWALVEAAMCGARRQDPIGRWGRRLAIRKGALKARVAMARALCEEIWRVWPRMR